jgi:hypothetical protein
MRTTMIIADQLMRELKKKAAEQKRTLSEVTEEALRRGLSELGAKRAPKRVKLRAFPMGNASVDISNREHLYDVLDRV